MASAHQHYYTEANRVMARPAALLDGQGGFSVHGSSGFVRSVVAVEAVPHSNAIP